MRALVTNDDGVDSPGIRALAQAGIDCGLDVVVAAPSWDSSGASASLTAVEHDGRFLFEERRWDHVPDVRVFAVQAAPAFIARVGAHGVFGPPPDLVLSGINRGPNTGRAVLHSGTVGAALTASTHGCRSLAVSIGVGPTIFWATAQSVTGWVLPWVMDAPPQTVLNLNVPNVELSAVRGLEQAELASFGAVQTNVTEVGRGYVKLAYTDVDVEHEPGTDAAWLADGYACFTPLVSPCADVSVDTSGLAFAFAAGSRR